MSKNKEQVIKFRAQSEHVWEIREKPRPAAKMIPDWYKDIPIYTDGAKKLMMLPGPNITVKKCFPVLDSLTMGYIMPLWTDVHVATNNGIYPEISWTTMEQPFELWSDEQVSSFEIPNGFLRSVFKFKHGWSIKTPPGYSCLITHPVGYPNTPYRSLTGVVDTDSEFETEINTPMVIQKGWEGIIEKGSPMFQIIPFKRNDWISEFDLMKPNEHYYNLERIKSVLVTSYNKARRTPKFYK